jgi:hypothetical protein
MCSYRRKVLADVAQVNHLLHDDRALMRLFQVLVLVAACQWGIDYIQHPEPDDLYVFERMMDGHPIPLPVIGWLLLSLGMLGLVGELWFEMGDRKTRGTVPAVCTASSRWWPSFTAHSGLCAAYIAIGVGSLIQMLWSGDLYGWRMTGGAGLLAFAHYIYMQRRRNAP